MSSPSLPAQDPTGPPSTTSSVRATAPATAAMATAGATARIGDLDTFIAALAAGESELAIAVARGGPTREVRDQIAAAGAIGEQLRASGSQLRFFAAGPGERTKIELHDGEGNLVRSVSVAEALDMAAGKPIE
jgi:hypothetical protein